MELTAHMAMLAYGQESAVEDLVPTVRRHNEVLIKSLGAYVQGQPLLAYQPLPLNDPAALLRW